MKRTALVILVLLLIGGFYRTFAAGNLFINEILFEPPTSLENPFEYIELRGAAGEVIPANTFLFAIEGGGSNAGKIRNYFDLGGRQIGTNGFLVLLQKGHAYSTVAGSGVVTNSATLGGWGDGSDTTVGHDGEDGRTNLENASVTFLLVRCTSTPSEQHLNIDTNKDGAFDGEAAAWIILDGVGLLDDATGTYGCGKINFVETGGTSSATNKVFINFTGGYVARNGHTTGSASTDWVVADVSTNGTPQWQLHASNVVPSGRAGSVLDHIGGANFGATFNYTPVLKNSSALSGVVNHPGNPDLPLDIYDAETASNLLQVTATSLQTNSLPADRVTLVLTNGRWVVRFSPTNVCYDVGVRIHVSDGTNYSESIVGYSASGLWNTNVGFHIGISDASTAVPTDTDFMLVADDETFPIRLYSRTNAGLPIKQFDLTSDLGLVDTEQDESNEDEVVEMDVEASSRFGNRIYWLGSLGNITDGPLAPNRNRIFATDISGAGTNVQLTYAGRYERMRDDILNWDTTGAHGKGVGYYGLQTSAAELHPPKTNDGFCVEAFCFINGGTSNQAYIGMRAPLVPRGERRRALLIPIFNLGSVVTTNVPPVSSATFGSPVELDLGGRGIRSIEHINGAYWIVAGPPGDTTEDRYEFRLFTWSGNVLEPAQMWSADFSGIRPEGIVDVRTNGSTVEIQVVGDHGFSRLYQPVVNTTAKKVPSAFAQFRLEWVPIGTAQPLQVLGANFASSGATRFVRGSGSSNQWLTIVEALDNIPGVQLDDSNGNANSFYAGHDWTNQLHHWNLTNAAQPFLFNNPLAAFGSMAGMPTLYVGRTYHFYANAGTSIGTNRQLLRVTAYDRSTKQQIGWQELQLPASADANYQAFFERGLAFNFPRFGLDTRIRPQFVNGAPVAEFTVEHRAWKAEYFFVLSLAGQTYSNAVSTPLVSLSANQVASPLYVLNFDLEPAWQSHFLAQPHLHGEPAPSAFLGQSVEELRATNFLNNMSLVLTQSLDSLTNVDLSPELRRHPKLDRLVTDYDRDPVALANYVLNEVLLSDAFTPGAASGILRSGGVRRGALATYMEGQGSPLEQCALLVYLMRRCQIPAGYVFPTTGTLKLHQNSLERLFPFTVQVSGSTNGNILVDAEFPFVAAYVDGQWRAIAPWLKDLEIQEGLDITDYMPDRYRTGRDWAQGYLRYDMELMKLAVRTDTPTTLFPRYLKQMLKDNYVGLSLEDFGVRVRARKHHYSRWTDFPVPAVLAGTNIIIESLATVVQSQSSYSNLFESVQVDVTSTTNTSRKVTSGKFRLIDLHNRALQLWFVETNGNHQMNLGLNSFRSELTNVVSFSNAVAASFSSTQSLNELWESVTLDSTDDDLTIQLQWFRHQSIVTSTNAAMPAVTLFQPDQNTNSTVIQRKLRKGDLATLCFDAGSISGRMLESLTEDLARAKAAKNGAGAYLRPELVNGLTAFTLSANYFGRVDAFRGPLARLYKTHVDSARSVAVSSMLAKRQTNGVLLSGAIQLSSLRLDVCFREMSVVGNGNLRSDVSTGNERAVQDFLDLQALNEGAQEHQTIADLFGGTNVVSTVRLLQLSQLQGLVSQPGILRLTATNYVAYGNTSYGGTLLKNFDSTIWQTIQTVFSAPGLSNSALVLMTPGYVSSAVGNRVGALILSPRYHAALLSPGLNGAEGDAPPVVEMSVSYSGRLLLGNDQEWHDIDWFAHDIFGGDNYVVDSERFQGPYALEFLALAVLVDTSVPVADLLLEYVGMVQLQQALDADLALRIRLADDYGLPLSATASQIMAAIQEPGYLPRNSYSYTFGNLVSDPVSPITGEFFVSDQDMLLPGPLPLVIARTYSSRHLGEGAFGMNWKINLTPYLVRMPNETAIDGAEPDGTVLRYTKIAADQWKALWQDNPFYDNSSAPPGPAQNLNNHTIVRTNSATITNYVLFPGDGSARVYTLRSFPKAGLAYLRPWLTSWVDPHGNSLRFEYRRRPAGFRLCQGSPRQQCFGFSSDPTLQ